MTDLAQPLPIERPRERAAERVLGLRLALSWEAAAYVALFVTAFGFRMWDLGSRALHHDESLHGYYAYQLYLGHGYEHTPLMHGPFQFFGTALVYFLAGGASDYTVRILPALFGTALVALPLLFRGRLGRTGALVAAALIAFSPTLLYYSRFARNDIYVAVFTLGLVICLWRYVEERRPRYLYIAAALLGLSFAAKENTFITASILLLFLDLWLAADFADQSGRRLGEPWARPFYFLAYVPTAWLLAALWPLAGGLRRLLGLRERPPAADFLVVLGALTAPQLAAAVQVPLDGLFAVELNSLAAERLVGVPTVLLLLAGSAAVGLGWNWRSWLVVAACFSVPYVLLYTSFFTNPGGFGSGIWESLDYWLAQHAVRRGDQPDFYYLVLLPAYEFLPLALAGPALLYYSLRGGLRSILLTVLATVSLLAFFGADSFSPGLGKVAMPVALPVAAVALFAAVRGSPFERFLVFWVAASIVAYSWVGEKMPWLSVHTTLPVVILAAYTAGRLIATRDTRHEAQALGTWGEGRGTREAPPHRWKAEALRHAPRLLAGGAGVAVVGALAVLSVRTAVGVTYEHGDVPREPLIYTQTSPQVPDLAARIDGIAAASGRGRDLPIQVDGTYTWPWAWYLRDYTHVTYVKADEAFQPEPGAVVLVASQNQGSMAPFEERYEPPVRHYLRWWFPEDYGDIGRDNLAEAMGDFAKDLARADTWRKWWRFFWHRDGKLQGVEELAYFPLEYERPGLGGPAAPSPGGDLEGRLIIGGQGVEPGQFSGPTGAAVDAQGNLYVADSGNGRIEKFDPAGRLIAAVGGPGVEAGQFNQPADLAVDGQGNVYVADTWNHRIQKLDANLQPVAAWGQATNDLLNPAPDGLWGPRGVAVDGEGNVWVADTGTHRVLKFGADGTPLGAFGGRGYQPGRFVEPVGLAFGPDGSLFVADAGNARIQRFDRDFNVVAVYPIAEWSDLSPANKPYLAALPDGRLLATDGPHGRILLIDGEGTVAGTLTATAGVPLFAPAGVAFDAVSGFVYVSDSLGGHVRRFPLTDFARR